MMTLVMIIAFSILASVQNDIENGSVQRHLKKMRKARTMHTRNTTNFSNLATLDI